MNLNSRLEYGDYQTPLDFCEKVINVIKEQINPDIVFEPTFGLGHFLISAFNCFKKAKILIGNEINKEYYQEFLNKYNMHKFLLFNEDIFKFDHKKIIKKINKNEKLLIIGNPPWVTNSQLMSNSMKNLPKKSNIKKLKGFDSKTGASNFDICEYIIINLLNNYSKKNTTLAMLCKTNVATNIIKCVKNYDFRLKDTKMYLFNAKKIFNANCEACLFVTTLDDIGEEYAKVYDLEEPNKELYEFGWKNNKFVSNFNKLLYDIDGEFYTEWRQGVKHDCSKIMELRKVKNNIYINKLQEKFEIEDKYVYKLLKSSDLKNNVITDSDKYVIITQKIVKQDTEHIAIDAPKTWQYLLNHKELFEKRKSSIYENSPVFSIFGIGDYSFYKYKVAISGFYKDPNFVFIDSCCDKAIMLDDTCYFIGFNDKKEAYISMILLNSDIVKNFLSNIAFLDKKRPYTKDILMRIDMKKVIKIIDYNKFKKISKKYNDYINITENDYKTYQGNFLDNE